MDASTLSNLAAYSAQIAYLAAGGALVPTLLRIEAPAIRYLYWRALLVLCVALPWLQGREHAASRVGLTTTAVGPATALTGPAGPGAIETWSATIDWLAVASLVLVGGALLRLLWIGVGLLRLQRLRSAGDAAMQNDEHDELQRTIGTRAAIRYVPGLSQPVTFGVLRPVVLLPEILREQSPAIERAVLCHELFHVERRDWAWVLVEELVRSALWFHPAVWWLVARVQLAREEVVDELAVLATGTRRTYIEALLAFADASPLAPAAAFSRRRHLFRRIVLISKETVMSSRRVVLSCFVMALAMVAGSVYTTRAFPLAAAAQQLLPVAGRVESRARPITPENPIPRRIYSVTPQYPVEALNVDLRAATIVLKITLNGGGRATEMRRIGFLVFSRQPSVSAAISRDPMPSVQEALAQGPVQGDASTIAPVVEALFRSAADAVGQWQYDSPAEAPISFFVQLEFRADGTVALTSQSPTIGPAGGFSAARVVVTDRSTPSTSATSSGRGASAGAPRPGGPSGVPGGSTEATVSIAPIRIGGNVKAPTKIKDVEPIYPAIAQSARISGIVIIEATVGTDGRVAHARILRSIPLLDQAALDAVTQWEFTPLLLNGAPTPIIMSVTVNFVLAPPPAQ